MTSLSRRMMQQARRLAALAERTDSALMSALGEENYQEFMASVAGIQNAADESERADLTAANVDIDLIRAIQAQVGDERVTQRVALDYVFGCFHRGLSPYPEAEEAWPILTRTEDGGATLTVGDKWRHTMLLWERRCESIRAAYRWQYALPGSDKRFDGFVEMKPERWADWRAERGYEPDDVVVLTGLWHNTLHAQWRAWWNEAWEYARGAAATVNEANKYADRVAGAKGPEPVWQFDEAVGVYRGSEPEPAAKYKKTRADRAFMRAQKRLVWRIAPTMSTFQPLSREISRPDADVAAAVARKLRVQQALDDPAEAERAAQVWANLMEG